MWVNAYERKFIWEDKTKRKRLELPAQRLTLVSAFDDKSRRVKKQIFVHVKLGTVFIDHAFLVSPQLLTAAILGVDLFINLLKPNDIYIYVVPQR